MGDRDQEVSLGLRGIQRLEVLREVQRGNRTQVEAGRILKVTDRQIRTLLGRLKARGPTGLVHGNRGRPSPRRIPEEVRTRLAGLYREKYADFNLTHFREMLQAREGLAPPGREFLRQLLRDAGLWQRRRDAPKHRLRRPRRAREGELLQLDASLHGWLGDEQGIVALVGAIDDATGDVAHAAFSPAETTEAYFGLLEGILRKRGIPLALYGDRDSVFQVNNVKEREVLKAQGKIPHTQFSRALEELGIQWIAAHSPQAKGRIERLWGTFQDRLLKELRLEGRQTLQTANAYLCKIFLPAYNRRFRRDAAEPGTVYRPAPSTHRLKSILCRKERRVLARDHTFSLEGSVWQVLPSDAVPALTGRPVEVRTTMQGRVEAWHGTVRLKIRPAPTDFPRRELAAAAPSYPVRGKVRM